MHGIEEGDVGKNTRIIDLWRPNEDVAEKTCETIPNHLSGKKEHNPPYSTHLFSAGGVSEGLS